MTQRMSYEELQAQLMQTVRELEALAERAPGRGLTEADMPATVELLNGVRDTLLAAATGMGECQMDVPFAPMHPVRHPDGRFEWCCSHNPTHCHLGS